MSDEYKRMLDRVLAEKKFELQRLNNSVLWSPKFRPGMLKYLVIPLVVFPFALVRFLQYVHYPKKMVNLLC